MATPPNPGSVLETMEKGEHKVQNAESVTLAGVESARNGKLPKRGVEGGIAEPCAHENNNSGQAWISVHVSPLSESTRKLLNRLGTERYASNHYASLKEAGFISWKRERNNFAKGDIVYVFSSKEGKIIYKTEVVAEEMRADGKYWIERPPMQMTWRLKAVEEYVGDALDKATLKLYGLKSLQRPMWNKPELFAYIESQFEK